MTTSDPKIRLFIDFLVQTMGPPNLDHGIWPEDVSGSGPSLIIPSAPISILSDPAAEVAGVG